MRIYSGECEHGLCGLKTPLIDSSEKPLFVGDIVATSTKNDDGVWNFDGITVVIEDRPELVGRIEKGDPFIMGLASEDFTKHNDKWFVFRVKSYKDVISGEHWKDFGFNYKFED
jgi:hypothetical protein